MGFHQIFSIWTGENLELLIKSDSRLKKNFIKGGMTCSLNITPNAESIVILGALGLTLVGQFILAIVIFISSLYIKAIPNVR